MKVHHLNCGTMCPLGGRLINRSPARMVCHCLLIEGRDSLALVDTGIGLQDCADPGRLGAIGTALRARFDPRETAFERVKALGFDPKDVRHLVPTHLDLDHAGGIADFPWAEVHVWKGELEAALNPLPRERMRYRACQWEHGPRWVTHESRAGDDWEGFSGVRPIAGLDEELALIPLHGHTRGHCGVAALGDDGWMLHAGDAYFYEGELDPAGRRCTPGLRLFQRLAHLDHAAAMANQERLRALAASGDGVRIFCAHDPSEYERASGATL